MSAVFDETPVLLGKLLSTILGRQLSTLETTLWLADARLWEIMEREEFVERYAAWQDLTPGQRQLPWEHGGGRSGQHTNPNPKILLPDRLKGIDEEIKRLMSGPPFPGRGRVIDDLKRKSQHFRAKGEHTGEEHWRSGKSSKPPGARESEGLDDE